MKIVKPVVKAFVKPAIGAVSRTNNAVAAKAEPAAPAEERAVKSVTIRMPPNTLDMLEASVKTYESDRTETVKRSIRLLNASLSGYNSRLIIIDRAGNEKVIQMMIDGVPT